MRVQLYKLKEMHIKCPACGQQFDRKGQRKYTIDNVLAACCGRKMIVRCRCKPTGREDKLPHCETLLDEPVRLFVGIAVSLQHPPPFHLARL
jgi:hypothetical protein